MSKTSNSSKKIIYLKIAVTAILLGWLMGQIETAEIKNTIYNTDLKYLGYALITHLFAFIVLSIRWWLLLKAKINNCEYRDVAGSYYLGLFFNNILPTGMGGDVIRILRLRKVGLNTQSLISSTLADRIIGLASIVSMSVVAIFTLPYTQQFIDPVVGLSLFFAFVLACFLIFFSSWSGRLLDYTERKIQPRKWIKYLFDVTRMLLEYRKSRIHVLAAFALSLLAQHLVIISYLLVGYSLNITISVALYFFIMPIVFLATSLPISIGGLGVRESTLVALFTMFSVDTQSAIALSLYYFMVLVLVTTPAVFLLFSKQEKLLQRYNRSSVSS